MFFCATQMFPCVREYLNTIAFNIHSENVFSLHLLEQIHERYMSSSSPTHHFMKNNWGPEKLLLVWSHVTWRGMCMCFCTRICICERIFILLFYTTICCHVVQYNMSIKGKHECFEKGVQLGDVNGQRTSKFSIGKALRRTHHIQPGSKKTRTG